MTQNGKAQLVPIELGGKTRNIRLDFNALALAEELTGKSFVDIEAWGDMRATDIRAVIYACLVHEDPELTLEQVGGLLHMGNVERIALELVDAFVLSMPEDDGAEADDQAKKEDG